jgi:hypothetical protein
VKAESPVVLVVDQRLGTLRWSEDGVVGLDLFPRSERVIGDLAERGVPVWLVADVDPSACRLLARWFPGVAGVRSLRDRRGSMAVAAALGRLAGRGVFCAADRVLRAAAATAGWQAVPDPATVAWVLDGHEVRLARIDAADEVLDRLPHVVVAERDARGVLAFTTDSTLAHAAVAGATVQRLPVDLSRQDAVWVRTRGAADEVASALAGRPTLAATGGDVLVAVDAADDLADSALHAAHGHFGLVAPTPNALARRRPPVPGEADLIRWPWPELPDIVVDLPPARLDPCFGWDSTFADDVERYAGLRPLDASGSIASRHVRHPDNDRAVDALLADLRAIGYCPWVHTFSHAGRTVRNVLADLPARGRFIRSDILEAIRRILADPDVLRDPRKLADRLRRSDHAGALDRLFDDGLAAVPLHERLRQAVRIDPWLPWWLRLCFLSGLGAGIVVVGCHLDSTAGRDPGYAPATGAAPGADDDASGIAGTLAVARWLWPLRHTLTHTVRFAFFNAEEEGLVGSAAYASHLASFGAPVEAVVCMDMIGFNSDAQALFEVHAGSPSAAIRDASEPIADRVAAWTATLGALPAPQIYRGTNPGAGTDRNVYDGAIGRSDHASFQANGYPAVVVSEDFFANLASEPASDANPSYHRGADTVIDPSYGSAIACAVAHTVRDLATNGL